MCLLEQWLNDLVAETPRIGRNGCGRFAGGKRDLSTTQLAEMAQRFSALRTKTIENRATFSYVNVTLQVVLGSACGFGRDALTGVDNRRLAARRRKFASSGENSLSAAGTNLNDERSNDSVTLGDQVGEGRVRLEDAGSRRGTWQSLRVALGVMGASPLSGLSRAGAWGNARRRTSHSHRYINVRSDCNLELNRGGWRSSERVAFWNFKARSVFGESLAPMAAKTAKRLLFALAPQHAAPPAARAVRLAQIPADNDPMGGLRRGDRVDGPPAGAAVDVGDVRVELGVGHGVGCWNESGTSRGVVA